jgi:hypothetical protein
MKSASVRMLLSFPLEAANRLCLPQPSWCLNFVSLGHTQIPQSLHLRVKSIYVAMVRILGCRPYAVANSRCVVEQAAFPFLPFSGSLLPHLRTLESAQLIKRKIFSYDFPQFSYHRTEVSYVFTPPEHVRYLSRTIHVS